MEAKKVNGSDVIADMTARDARVILVLLSDIAEDADRQCGGNDILKADLFSLLHKAGRAAIDFSKKAGCDEKQLVNLTAQVEKYRVFDAYYKLKY